jgi:hypothetical protein
MTKRQRDKLDKKLGTFRLGKGKNTRFKERKANKQTFVINFCKDPKIGTYIGFDLFEG